MEWRNSDWAWLLLFIAYSSFLMFYNNDDVVAYISFGSTLASIALAGVAIYIAVREATKVDNVKTEINTILGEMKEKLGQVDSKVSSIDITALNSQIDTTIEQIKNLYKKASKSDDTHASNGTEDNKINEKISELKEDLKSNILITTVDTPHKLELEARLLSLYITFDNTGVFTLKDVQRRLTNIFGVQYDSNRIKRIMAHHVLKGILIKVDDGYLLPKNDDSN